MSNEKRFGGRRRRGGMRFKPSGGINQNQPPKNDKDAVAARADAVGEVVGGHGQEKLFERRHTNEIERAENIAAGLPPEGAPEIAPGHEHQHQAAAPAPLSPGEVEKPFEPVKVVEKNRSLVEKITDVAANLVKKVQRLIRPEKKIHKEVIINAETLETRVAVSEDGKLEEFNIERTTEERLVGSIFKGKVRNLEDGLKAAFVDIGFEKNAFLHYWDIVPNQFDSGVEIVDRPTKRRDRPKITQKDIPRLYSPGAEIIIQVTKGPIGTKGPRVTTNLVLPGRYLAGDTGLIGVGEQHEITTGQHEIRRDARAFCADGTFGDLDDDLRAGRVEARNILLRDLGAITTFGGAIHDFHAAVELVGHDIPVVEEGVLLETDVHERRFQSIFEITHLAFEDAADKTLLCGAFDVEFLKLAVLRDSDARFKGLSIDDDFLVDFLFRADEALNFFDEVRGYVCDFLDEAAVFFNDLDGFKRLLHFAR